MTATGGVPTAQLRELLLLDLATMSVPGTALQVRDQGKWLRVDWERRDGEHLVASFLLQGDVDFSSVRVRLQDGSELAYRSFMAGPSMANLSAVARATLGVLHERAYFVSPLARVEVGEGSQVTNAVDVLAQVASGHSQGVTNLVFVTGAAGDGKTWLLEVLTRRMAEAYRRKQADQLWLYVSAQGRRLARLDDAVSRETQRLQAPFPYEAVAPLVRCGLLVLVVDGFDELLGVAGSYDESFSSLASFLDGLSGRGVTIAAARSAYYEQEFLDRLNRTTGFTMTDWAVTQVALQEWTASQHEQYLQLSGCGSEIVVQRLEKLFSTPSLAPLSGKPFFYTRAAELLQQDIEGSISDATELLAKLVDAYLAREAEEKLVEAPNRPYLTTEQLVRFFSEVAEEMWRQDTKELSRSSVRELIEVLGELEGLGPEAQQAVTDRGAYASVLQAGATPGSVTFEHDVYLGYFLAEPVREALATDRPLAVRQALRRSQLPPEVSEFVSAAFLADPQRLLTVLAEAARKGDSASEQVRRAGGLIAASVISKLQTASNLHVANLDFIDASLAGVKLHNLHLVRCLFDGCDLRGAVLSGTAQQVTMRRMRLDRTTTQLHLDGLDVYDVTSLVASEESGSSYEIFDPVAVRAALRACGLPSAKEVVQARIVSDSVKATIEQFARVAQRGRLFTEADDVARVRRLVESADWVRVRDALQEAGILSPERRSASGNKLFWRIHGDADAILMGLDASVSLPPDLKAFWESVPHLSSNSRL